MGGGAAPGTFAAGGKNRRAATDLRQAYTNNLLLRSTVTLAANNSAKTPTNSEKNVNSAV